MTSPIIARRAFLGGLIAAPAVLRLGLWMPVKRVSDSIVTITVWPRVNVTPPWISEAEAEKWIQADIHRELAKIIGVPEHFVSGIHFDQTLSTHERTAP